MTRVCFMNTQPLPLNENLRLAALRELDILDTPPDDEFDAIVRVAALACGAPICASSLIDESRQWLKAQIGLGAMTETHTPRDVTFCAHAIHGPDIFEVSDALKDPRFADNPLVTGAPDIRFYAGMPLATESGHRLGTLCILDRQPRRLTDAQRDILRNLGQAAASALRGWGARKQQKAIATALEQERQRMAVTLLGGRLGHADNIGGGSVFWMELPVALPAQHLPPPRVPQVTAPAPPLQTGAVPAGAALRVLVVDDVAMNLESRARSCAWPDMTCAMRQAV
jgi:hypothetical protein